MPMPYLDELRQKLKLEVGDPITEDWYDDLVNYLEKIEKGSAVDYIGYVHRNIIPEKDALFNIGVKNLRFKQVHSVYGYFSYVKSNTIIFHNLQGDDINADTVKSKVGDFSEKLTVQGKVVLKDEDPIHISSFYDYAKNQLQDAVLNAIYSWSPPPLQLDDKSLGIAPRMEDRIEQGRAFSASKRFDSVADGSIIQVVFSNPTGSGKVVYIVAIEIIATGQGAIDIYRDVSIDAHGTDIPIMNLDLGSDNLPVCEIEYGGTYSDGTLAHQTVVHGGTKINAVGSLSEVGEKVKIPEGHNIMVQFENRAGVDVDVSIRFLWWEDPTS